MNTLFNLFKKNTLQKTKDLELLSFSNHNQNTETYIDFDTATKNICILGGTGSGKTTSICYPALYKLAKYDCAGLILDIKGGYSNFGRLINEKFPQKTEILGVYTHCTKINLIAGISPYKLREFLTEAVSNQMGERNSYWGMNGIEDFVLIYELLISKSKSQSPTLADLYYLFNSPFELEKLVDEAKYKIYKKIQFRKNSDTFSIFNNNNTETTSEQRTWQFSVILKYLKPFFEDPYIREYFCNEQCLSFDYKIYNENKIIILDLPSSQYGDVSVFISQLLRAMFKDTVKNKGEGWLQSNGYGTDKFTFLLVDEYQQFISTNSSPSMDDNNWFDTSRGYGNINIISTQSIDSLINKTNIHYTQQLLGNCRNIIHLPTNAKSSLDNILELSSHDTMKKLKKPDEAGLAMVYIGQNIARKGISKEVILCNSKDKMMNFFISDAYKEMNMSISNELDKENEDKDYDFPYEITISHKERSNTWVECSNPKFFIDRNVHIITSKSKSSGFLDFNHIINQGDTIFKNVKIYSEIHFNDLPLSFLKNIDVEKNDLILFIRGGGNFKNSFFHMPEHKKEFTKLKKKAILGVGYGHIDDNFQDLKYFTLKGITPTDLAYKILLEMDKTTISNDEEKKETSPKTKQNDQDSLIDIDKLFT